MRLEVEQRGLGEAALQQLLALLVGVGVAEAEEVFFVVDALRAVEGGFFDEGAVGGGGRAVVDFFRRAGRGEGELVGPDADDGAVALVRGVDEEGLLAAEVAEAAPEAGEPGEGWAWDLAEGVEEDVVDAGGCGVEYGEENEV